MGFDPVPEKPRRGLSRWRAVPNQPPERTGGWFGTAVRTAVDRQALARLAVGSHLDVLVMVLLIAVSLGLTLPRLTTPTRYFYDEILYAYTAREYLRGTPEAHRWDGLCAVGRNDDTCLESNSMAQVGKRIGKFEWTHPPLSKELIAGGTAPSLSRGHCLVSV